MAQVSQRVVIEGMTYHMSTDMPLTVRDLNMGDRQQFGLSLTNGIDVFTGTLSATELVEMSTAVDMEVETFYSTLRRCLCSGGRPATGETGRVPFVYQLTTDDNSSSKLVLKQVVDENMKFQLGYVVLQKNEESGQKIVEMLNSFSKVLTRQKLELETLYGRIETFEMEKKEMARRLEGYVDVKESLEKELFTKFVMVLNEKKKKIRELKKKLEHGNKDGDRGDEVKKPAEKKKKKVKESSDEDTDDEKKRTMTAAPATAKVVPKQVAAPTKRKNVVLKNEQQDDIVLDGGNSDDEEEILRTRKRTRATKSTVNELTVEPARTELLSSTSKTVTTMTPVSTETAQPLGTLDILLDGKPPRGNGDSLDPCEKDTQPVIKAVIKDTQEDLLDQLMF